MRTQPSSSTTLKTGTGHPSWMPDCDECGDKNGAVVKSHGYLMCGDCAMKELEGKKPC